MICTGFPDEVEVFFSKNRIFCIIIRCCFFTATSDLIYLPSLNIYASYR